MKVIAAHTMQEIDRAAIGRYGIPGVQLMENAGRCCVEEIIARFGLNGSAVVMAGKGNNGGDGYVIARLLGQNGWRVRVIVLADRDRITGDAAINLGRLPDSAVSFCPREGQLSALHREEISRADVIVDALLGTGLCSNVSGVYLEAVELINASGRPLVAVDIPSGIDGTSGRKLGNAVRACLTVTFACRQAGAYTVPGRRTYRAARGGRYRDSAAVDGSRFRIRISE